MECSTADSICVFSQTNGLSISPSTYNNELFSYTYYQTLTLRAPALWYSHNTDRWLFFVDMAFLRLNRFLRNCALTCTLSLLTVFHVRSLLTTKIIGFSLSATLRLAPFWSISQNLSHVWGFSFFPTRFIILHGRSLGRNERLRSNPFLHMLMESIPLESWHNHHAYLFLVCQRPQFREDVRFMTV
jgi:hypothetical protein